MDDSTNIKIVDGDDWMGVYIKGKLVREDHNIPLEEVLELIGINVQYIYADRIWLGQRGSLPECLEDVKLERF